MSEKQRPSSFEITQGASRALNEINKTLDARPWGPMKEGDLLHRARLLRRSLQRITFEESVPDYNKTVEIYNTLRAGLPQEFVRKKFAREFPVDDGTTSDNDKKTRVGNMNGAILEMQRINEMRENPDFIVDFSVTDKIPMDYVGYDLHSAWSDVLKQQKRKMIPVFPSKRIKGAIELDVPIRLKGRENVPYIYEVKDYRTGIWGSYKVDTVLNQLMKYDQAVERGLASGATVEVRGRLDPRLLQWLNPKYKMVPNVEVVYVLPLPSGLEYRFVLKPGSKTSLRIQTWFIKNITEDDKLVIKGINRAMRYGYRGLMVDYLTRFDLDPSDREEGAFTLNPHAIQKPDDFVKYQYLITSKIWQRFTNIAMSGIPEKYVRLQEPEKY